MRKSQAADHALQTFQAIRIVGHLLNHVKLPDSGPILSYVKETVGEFVSKTNFGTKAASTTLEIFEIGDMSHQFMYEKWEETALLLGRLSKICLSEFGEVTLNIKEKVGMKIIIINFKPAMPYF